MASGRAVLGDVVADHPFRVKFIGKLEGQHRVDDLPASYLLDVLDGAHLLVVLGISRNPAADDNAFQVQLFAEFFSRVVEPAAKSHPLVVLVDEQVDAVEIVSLGVMPFEAAVGDDILVGVIRLEIRIIDDQGQGGCHNLSLVIYADLPLGKQGKDRVEFILFPGAAHPGIGILHDVTDVFIIRMSEIPDFKLVSDDVVSQCLCPHGKEKWLNSSGASSGVLIGGCLFDPDVGKPHPESRGTFPQQ